MNKVYSIDIGESYKNQIINNQLKIIQKDYKLITLEFIGKNMKDKRIISFAVKKFYLIFFAVISY